MKASRALGIVALIVGLMAGIAIAQSSPRIIAGNGTIEISRGNGWMPLSITDQIAAKDRIRTGVGSFATLEFTPGKAVILGDQTEISLQQAGSSPMVVLVSGNIKVVSDSEIRIDAKGSMLESAGEPLEMDVLDRAGRMNVIVNKGAVRSGALIIRASAESAYRTYTAGGNRDRMGYTTVFPSVYFYPYFIYADRNVPNAPPAPNQPFTGFMPPQIVAPMTDPLRPPVHYPVNPFPYRPPRN